MLLIRKEKKDHLLRSKDLESQEDRSKRRALYNCHHSCSLDSTRPFYNAEDRDIHLDRALGWFLKFKKQNEKK